MSLKDVKARIAAVMLGVTGIGQVYTEHPNPKTEVDVEQQMKSNGRINVWIIERDTMSLTDLVVNQNFAEQRDYLLIEGYYSFFFGDGSADVFNDLVDAIVQAINADRRPPSEFTKLVSTATPPTFKFGLAMYANQQVLCRKAEIRMQIVRGYLQ